MNLTELQEVDPKTYDSIMQILQYVPEYDAVLWGDIIQGESQRAIEKRMGKGWTSCQQGFSEDSLHHWCYIFREGEETMLGEGDSPAEALLAAYLEAIHES